MAFYTVRGLGRATHLLRHGENSMPVCTQAMRGQVMRAQFDGPGVRFFASDNGDAEPVRNSALMLMLDDPELTRQLFARLGEGRT